MFRKCLANYKRYLLITGEGNELEKIFIEFCEGINNETPGSAFKKLATSFGYFNRGNANGC